MEHQYTETGIQIGFRYASIFEIPEDVRPVVNPSPLRDFPKGDSGKHGPGARMGRDRKTYWCRSCNAAVIRESASWCDRCEKERNAAARRESRAREAGRPTEVTFPLDVLTQLVTHTDAVIDRIGDATMEFDRPLMQGGAIDDLMLATKDLAGFLSREIHPKVKRAAAPPPVTVEEARQRRRPPAAPPGQAQRSQHP